jgi:DNA-binding response OmpR family regulator
MQDPSQPAVRRILVLDADPALAGLIGEWLANEGEVHARTAEAPAHASVCYDLLVVDLPFPRRAMHDILPALAQAHPGTPVLALSPTFLGGVAGQVAHELGVDAVLPKPLARAQLLSAVRRLLGGAAKPTP